MKCTVLVIEDSVDTRELYAMALMGHHYRVETCSCVSEALEFLKTKPLPELIVCDVMMPGMDGDEFVGLLRRNPKWSSTRVVVVSGVDNLKRRASEMGADGFLRKPFDLQTLENTVNEHLSVVC